MKTVGLGLALAALAACKGKPDQAAPPPPEPVAPLVRVDAAPVEALDAAATPAVRGAVACPIGDDALRTAAQKIFALKGEIGVAQCTAIFAEGAGHWLIELDLVDDVGHRFYAGLVDATTGQATWTFTFPTDDASALDRHEVVDLDGNGDEELLSKRHVGGDGRAHTTLELLAIAGGKVVERAELPLGFTNEGAVAIELAKQLVRCEGAHQLVDGPEGQRLVEIIGGKHVGTPRADYCPKIGRQLYRYDGQALVEIAP